MNSVKLSWHDPLRNGSSIWQCFDWQRLSELLSNFLHGPVSQKLVGASVQPSQPQRLSQPPRLSFTEAPPHKTRRLPYHCSRQFLFTAVGLETCDQHAMQLSAHPQVILSRTDSLRSCCTRFWSDDDVELHVLGCRLTWRRGVNRCDQCRSTVHCGFTSTETVRLIIGRKAKDGHLNFHTAPELRDFGMSDFYSADFKKIPTKWLGSFTCDSGNTEAKGIPK